MQRHLYIILLNHNFNKYSYLVVIWFQALEGGILVPVKW